MSRHFQYRHRNLTAELDFCFCNYVGNFVSDAVTVPASLRTTTLKMCPRCSAVSRASTSREKHDVLLVWDTFFMRTCPGAVKIVIDLAKHHSSIDQLV